MKDLSQVISIVLPVFVVIALGMLCRVRRIISPEGIAAIRKVAVNITLPAVSLASFSQVDYSGKRILIPAWVFLVCLIALAMGFMACRVLKLPGKTAPYLCSGFEGGMLGFALYPLAFGTLAPFAIVDLGQVFFIFTVYKILLSGAHGAKKVFREAIASPSIWAVTLGLIIGASGLHRSLEGGAIQRVFISILDFVAAPTAFMILLNVGYDLDLKHIRFRDCIGVVATRLAIMAIMLGVTVLVNRLFLDGIIETTAAVMLFILPAPFVLTAFSKEEAEAGFLSSSLSIMTIVTILGFAVMTLIAK